MNLTRLLFLSVSIAFIAGCASAPQPTSALILQSRLDPKSTRAAIVAALGNHGFAQRRGDARSVTCDREWDNAGAALKYGSLFEAHVWQRITVEIDGAQVKAMGVIIANRGSASERAYAATGKGAEAIDAAMAEVRKEIEQ